jgi:hypothetical protein
VGVVAWLAHSLQVRLIEEEASIAALLVDVLPGRDYVVNNGAQCRRLVGRMDHAERITRQNYPAHCSPGLGLVELADRIVNATLDVESLAAGHGIDGVGTEGSSWHAARVPSCFAKRS